MFCAFCPFFWILFFVLSFFAAIIKLQILHFLLMALQRTRHHKTDEQTERQTDRQSDRQANEQTLRYAERQPFCSLYASALLPDVSKFGDATPLNLIAKKLKKSCKVELGVFCVQQLVKFASCNNFS